MIMNTMPLFCNFSGCQTVSVINQYYFDLRTRLIESEYRNNEFLHDIIYCFSVIAYKIIITDVKSAIKVITEILYM